MRHKVLEIILPLVVLGAAPISASNDILIVPQKEPPVQPFEILDQDLLANDPIGATIVSHTLTSRGVLVRRESELKFTYSPGPDFWNARMDSFSYILNAESEERATVFLVADPKENLRVAIGPDLEITSSPPTLTLRDGTLGLDNFPSGSLPEVRLTATGQTSDSLLVASPRPALGVLGKASSSGSGGIEMEIDPTPFTAPSDTATRLARVSVQGDAFPLRTDIELSLSRDGGINRLTARCRHDGALIDAFTANLDGGLQRVALTWWAASVDNAFDGGMILEVGNRVVASFSGLDNRDSFDANLIETRLGLMDAAGSAGNLRLSRLRYSQLSEKRPALMPIFADGVESQDTSAWTAVVGAVSVTSAAKILGSQGISIPGTFAGYLVDGSPAAESHYRARFNFNPKGLHMAEGSELTLLAGSDPAGSVYPFAIELRRQSPGFELCAVAQPAKGPAVDIGCRNMPAAARNVMVLWWAAPGAEPKGGLIAWLASPSLDTSNLIGQRLDLDNRGQVIDEARFGVIDPGAGTSGEVHLDDFESWR